MEIKLDKTNLNLELDELIFIEISKFLKKLHIKGIVIGAESIILDTKTRLITSDIDFLLFEEDFSKLLNELMEKEEIIISNDSIINDIETNPSGWLSFNLHLKRKKHSMLIEFISINDIEKKYRNKLAHLIKKNKKSIKIKNTIIYYLPVEIIFIMRLAIADWKTYIYKTNAHISELKTSNVNIDMDKFNSIIKELELEDRASFIRFE